KNLKKNILFFFIALITVIPLIVWNYLNWGNPYGQHTLTNFRLSFVQYKSLFDIVLSRSIGFAKSFTGNFNILLLLATILSIILRFLYKEKLEKTTRILILTLSFSLYLIHLLSLILDKDPLFNLNKTQGFLTAYPILVFMIFIPEKTQINRYLIIILIYSIILAFLTQVTGGIQWGNRLILWAYPLISLFLASKWNYINKVCSRYSMFAFLSISLFIQVYGVYLVDRKYRAIYELNSFIEKDTKGVILTDSWWLNLEAIDKTKDRIVFMPKSSKKLLELCDIIKKNNLHEFTYLSSPYYRFISSSTWKEVYEKADFKPIKIIKFDSPKAEYMKLDGVVWVLK
ncbi:MAG: hypothetical protein JXA60_00525, partial [Candidatus Coatesbacteria bacterium]|nr:hypothetical protein [Candidatus Coatesbacteria bacterium]